MKKVLTLLLVGLIVLSLAGCGGDKAVTVENGEAEVASLEILDNEEIETKVGDKIIFKVKATPDDFNVDDIKLEAMHPEMVKIGAPERTKDGFTFEVEFVNEGKTGIKVFTDYLEFVMTKGITVYPK